MTAGDGSLVALVALGAFHGLNPGMGWLFAVARGLQEGARAPVLQSLPAIAAGHAASVFAIALAVTLTGSILTSRIVAVGGGALLVGFGLWRLLAARHFHWVDVRMTLWELTGWSFLMSSAHGTGLMLLPLLTHGAVTVPGHAHGVSSAAGNAVTAAVFVTGVHTLAMFIVAGVIAVVAYEAVGATILRRGWFTLDRVWAAALIGAGAATLLASV